MCTIVLLRNVIEGLPLVVVANRDELVTRSASPPKVLIEHNAVGARAVGGKDLARGGTWMGVTSSGLFAGITNQKSFRPPSADRLSRGSIVLEALRLGRASAVRAWLQELDPRRYNPFNLVYGDADGLDVAYGREVATVAFETVPEGVHVLPNDRLDLPGFPKVERASTALAGLMGASLGEALPKLRELAADHQLPPDDRIEEPPPDTPFTRAFVRALGAVCIHTPQYGTRSATLVALAPGRVQSYQFADGPPCTTPFEDHTSMLGG